MIPDSRLPYSVQIQTKTEDPNNIGLQVETWSTVATIRADIQPLNVSRELEQRAYGIIEAGITAKMFCNLSSSVQKNRRVVYDASTYTIEYVLPYRGHIEALLKPVVN